MNAVLKPVCAVHGIELAFDGDECGICASELSDTPICAFRRVMWRNEPGQVLERDGNMCWVRLDTWGAELWIRVEELTPT